MRAYPRKDAKFCHLCDLEPLMGISMPTLQDYLCLAVFASIHNNRQCCESHLQFETRVVMQNLYQLNA